MRVFLLGKTRKLTADDVSDCSGSSSESGIVGIGRVESRALTSSESRSSRVLFPGTSSKPFAGISVLSFS